MPYALLQPLIRFLTKRYGVVEGIENLPASGPFIVAANHISYVEPTAIALLVIKRTGQKVFSPTTWGVYTMFRRMGLTGYFGMLPVRRDEPALVLDHAKRRLGEGYPVMIYPEGKRISTPELGKGKTGVARLAHWTGVPVIPVGYQGPRAHGVGPSVVALFTRTHDIRIRIGTPVRCSLTAEPSAEQLTETTRTIMQAIGSLCDRAYPY